MLLLPLEHLPLRGYDVGQRQHMSPPSIAPLGDIHCIPEGA